MPPAIKAFERSHSPRGQRQEAGRERRRGQDPAPRVHVDDRTLLREADVHEPVVEVRTVGLVERWRYLSRFATTNDVHDRDREHEQRQDERRQRGRLDEPLDCEGREQKPSRSAPESPMKIRAG